MEHHDRDNGQLFGMQGSLLEDQGISSWSQDGSSQFSPTSDPNDDEDDDELHCMEFTKAIMEYKANPAKLPLCNKKGEKWKIKQFLKWINYTEATDIMKSHGILRDYNNEPALGIWIQDTSIDYSKWKDFLFDNKGGAQNKPKVNKPNTAGFFHQYWVHKKIPAWKFRKFFMPGKNLAAFFSFIDPPNAIITVEGTPAKKQKLSVDANTNELQYPSNVANVPPSANFNNPQAHYADQGHNGYYVNTIAPPNDARPVYAQYPASEYHDPNAYYNSNMTAPSNNDQSVQNYPNLNNNNNGYNNANMPAPNYNQNNYSLNSNNDSAAQNGVAGEQCDTINEYNFAAVLSNNVKQTAANKDDITAIQTQLQTLRIDVGRLEVKTNMHSDSIASIKEDMARTSIEASRSICEAIVAELRARGNSCQVSKAFTVSVVRRINDPTVTKPNVNNTLYTILEKYEIVYRNGTTWTLNDSTAKKFGL